MPVLGPNGQVLGTTANRIDTDVAQAWTAFSIENGLGVVRFRLPGAPSKLADIIGRELGADVKLSPEAWEAIDKGMVYELLPQEAILLGLKLIGTAERSMENAAALRILLGMFEQPLTQAAQLMQEVSNQTRAEHQLQYQRALEARLKRAETQEQTQQLAETPVTGPPS